MTEPAIRFDAKKCDDRHSNIRVLIGVLFGVTTMASAAYGLITWNSLAIARQAEMRVSVESEKQAAKVELIAKDLAVEIRATNEFRQNVAETLKELKDWMRASSRQQEENNALMLRLLHQENKREKSS